MRVLFNLFCRDIEAQARFYGALLGLPELSQLRSPIYRALAAGDTELGFNGEAAYELLALAERRPAAEAAAPVTAYATFMLEARDDVDAAARRAVALGGGVVKAPYRTYYGHWQAVLHDPEQGVFRVSAED